jgi:tRNA A-37 threonylcarbamoyl transferase component Bud32
MSSRGKATIGLAICAIAAAAAGLHAGALWRGAGSADAEETAKLDARAADLRERLETALLAAERPLQAEVVRAARLPGLRSALADRVDAATILDLFDTEDWWAPFKARDAAVVTNDRLVMIRGDKELALPAGLVSRATAVGVGAGVIAGSRPVLAAVASIAPLHRAEPTYLMLMSPFDAAALSRELGLPLALSDGRRMIDAGEERQKQALAGLVGREDQERVYDRAIGRLAVAVPTAASLWIWTAQDLPVAPVPGRGGAIWVGAAALFALAALLFGIRRAKAAGPVGIVVRSGATPPPSAQAPTQAQIPSENGGLATVPPSPSPTTGSPFPLAGPPPAGRVGSGEHVDARFASDGQLAHRPTETLGSRTAAAAAASDLHTFGRYHLLRRLDGGGMADIYTAVLHGVEGFRRIYVIKRLRPELARIRVAVEQFIDEAKLGSMLVHSNIVPVFDFGKVGDEYFMAQEYIIGRDLGRLLLRHVETTGRPLSDKLMFYVAHEVLDALGYAHAQPDVSGRPLGIVHRDVSPGNIMLTARGEVKLFDFGIVKATQRVSKTEVGVVKGNVSFMSPEQARGQAVDPRSDLFSLGLVIHHALTNNQLYLGESTFDQLLRAANGPKTEHLRMLAGLPPATAAILRRALAVDPNDRYQSAAEFAADLAPYAAGGKFEAAALMQTLFGEELRNAPGE